MPDFTALDPIDRLAAAYQETRLLTRRMRRHVAEAVTLGNVPAVRAALARYRTAVAWEQRCRRRYLRAVFAAYPCTQCGEDAQSGDTTAAGAARAARAARAPGSGSATAPRQPVGSAA